MIEAFLVSVLAVAVGEIGDKTQLLALLLAARFQKPWPIVAGIVVATLFNHTLAAAVGAWISARVDAQVLRWVLGLSFIAIALWALKPDTVDEEESTHGRYGVFVVTTVSFFLAEIGDKTQLATVALAAKYQALATVVAGTTLGMLIADVPAVLIGNAASPKFPLRLVRMAAALIFAVLGVAVLLGWSL
jgi:putative Ca2+/H+ antiporter (TMEM165/GDT1 family)